MRENPENSTLFVLDEDLYESLIRNTVSMLRDRKVNIGPRAAEGIVDALMAKVRIIGPHYGVYSDEMCPSMFATHDGWQQCELEPGHGDDHDSGEWGWSTSDPNAHWGDREPKNAFADMLTELNLLRAQLGAVQSLVAQDVPVNDTGIERYSTQGFNLALGHVRNVLTQAELDYRWALQDEEH